jgi:hypothetical protein
MARKSTEKLGKKYGRKERSRDRYEGRERRGRGINVR